MPSLNNIVNDPAPQSYHSSDGGPGGPRAEWTRWTTRGLLLLAISFAGWLGNRVVNTLDRTESAVAELRQGIYGVQQLITFSKSDLDGIHMTLTDHEQRLRQDREILTQHGLQIANGASRTLSLEQSRQADEQRILDSTRPPVTSIPRR